MISYTNVFDFNSNFYQMYGETDKESPFPPDYNDMQEINEVSSPTERMIEDLTSRNASFAPFEDLINNDDMFHYTQNEVFEEEKTNKTKINSESNGPTEKTSANSEEGEANKGQKNTKIFSITKIPKVKPTQIIEQETEKETPKFLGKKHQSENHTKFAFDNLVRKIKSKLFASLIIILNKSLEEKKEEETKTSFKENQKVKKGEVKYECFLKPDQKIILQTNVKENLDLLNKQLREILSEDVSAKVQNYSKVHHLKHNKYFIEKIKDDENKRKTNDILDMTFLQCLEHFRGTAKYEALNGLEEEYQKVIEEMSDDVDYRDNFIAQLKSFEEMYQNKKSRNSKKKKISNDEGYF